MPLPAPSVSKLSRRPQCAFIRASRERHLTCRVSAASSTCTSPQDVKKLWQLAGRKYGHALSGEGRQEVETHLNNIQQGVQQLDLTRTSWKLAYTTSQGQSGGRVGPFIGYVTQVSVLQRSSPSFLLPGTCAPCCAARRHAACCAGSCRSDLMGSSQTVLVSMCRSFLATGSSSM